MIGSATTDVRGEFELPLPPNQELMIQITHSDYWSREIDVPRLASGEVVDIGDVGLTPKPPPPPPPTDLLGRWRGTLTQHCPEDSGGTVYYDIEYRFTKEPFMFGEKVVFKILRLHDDEGRVLPGIPPPADLPYFKYERYVDIVSDAQRWWFVDATTIRFEAETPEPDQCWWDAAELKKQ